MFGILSKRFSRKEFNTHTGYIPPFIVPPFVSKGLIEEAKKMEESDIREKSGSITHLVKIVAEEVFEKLTADKFRGLADHVNKLFVEQSSHDSLHTLEMLGRVGNEFCRDIKSSLEKAGRPWTSEEDALLVQEIKTAVAQCAVNHQRSRGSIRARIEDKELMKR